MLGMICFFELEQDCLLWLHRCSEQSTWSMISSTRACEVEKQTLNFIFPSKAAKFSRGSWSISGILILVFQCQHGGFPFYEAIILIGLGHDCKPIGIES